MEAVTLEAYRAKKLPTMENGGVEMNEMKSRLEQTLKEVLPDFFEASEDPGEFTDKVLTLAEDYDGRTVKALTPLVPTECPQGELKMLGAMGVICKPCDPPKKNCHIVDGTTGSHCPKGMRVAPQVWSPKAEPKAEFLVNVRYFFGERAHG